MPATYPTRIVCLTEETTETLYLLGEDGAHCRHSGFTVRPPRARREKPRVSAFTSAKIDRIVELKPDLALGFSDLQAISLLSSFAPASKCMCSTIAASPKSCA
jgi:iron complex transport system substrate-binding protein